MEDLDERDARQWLCTNLAPLRARARAGGWEPKLDKAVVAVNAGRSAVAACRSLGYGGSDDSHRNPFGGGIPLSRLGLDHPAPVHGEYVCPKGLCGRRGCVDADGREPRCGLYGAVMDLRPTEGTVP